MIENYIQPKCIKVSPDLILVKYYTNYKASLPWYQDLSVCKQVDNIDYVYDKQRLGNMYKFLSRNGECYYIKAMVDGKFRLIGDISLCNNEIGIAICKEQQNKHYGRKATQAIINRAKQIGIKEIKVEIYSFNIQSKKMFLALGFTQIDEEHYILKNF